MSNMLPIIQDLVIRIRKGLPPPFHYGPYIILTLYGSKKNDVLPGKQMFIKNIVD